MHAHTHSYTWKLTTAWLFLSLRVGDAAHPAPFSRLPSAQPVGAAGIAGASWSGPAASQLGGGTVLITSQLHSPALGVPGGWDWRLPLTPTEKALEISMERFPNQTPRAEKRQRRKGGD